MMTVDRVDKCLSFIRAQLAPPKGEQPLRPECLDKLSITLSRQTGTGGLAIAYRLADYLQKHGPCPDKPWTVFDKNLVDEVLKRHNLPAEMAPYLSEERTSQLQDMVEEVLGLHPSAVEMVRRVTETILHLAELGNVILVGRGANLITARLRHVFHVRLVGTLECRIARLCRFEKIDQTTARRLIQESDSARALYVKRHFGADIENPLLYDLVLNTDRMSDEDAVQVIAQAALSRCRRPASVG